MKKKLKSHQKVSFIAFYKVSPINTRLPIGLHCFLFHLFYSPFFLRLFSSVSLVSATISITGLASIEYWTHRSIKDIYWENPRLSHAHLNHNQSPMDIKNTSIHLSISLDGKYFPKHKQTILHIGPCALSIALHYTSIHLFVSWWKMFFPNMCKNNMSHVCAIFIALHSKQLTWTSKIYQSISLFGKRYSQACPCVVSIIMHCKQITYLLSISISSLE